MTRLILAKHFNKDIYNIIFEYSTSFSDKKKYEHLTNISRANLSMRFMKKTVYDYIIHGYAHRHTELYGDYKYKHLIFNLTHRLYSNIPKEEVIIRTSETIYEMPNILEPIINFWVNDKKTTEKEYLAIDKKCRIQTKKYKDILYNPRYKNYF